MLDRLQGRDAARKETSNSVLSLHLTCKLNLNSLKFVFA